MMKTTVLGAIMLAATALFGAPYGELSITADRIAGDNVTGALAASGHIMAVSHPVRLMSDSVSRDANEKYVFSDPTSVTTCTNELDDLHWKATGEVVYENGKYILLRNMWVRMWDVPVLWVPYWYYPLDTDYGWRVMPGYTSRWGAYIMSKYVYGICGDFEPGHFGLSGATRLDLRSENGVALGQSVKWQLGNWGRGKFKAYYAWDEDADRYDRHWSNAHRWNYQNWGSTVPNERYALHLEHKADLTERDILSVEASYYSDSHFHRDFLRDVTFGLDNDFGSRAVNVLAWEHIENSVGFGANVSGPLNDFYGGTARLPETYFEVQPQPLFSLPVNYESLSHIGYYNRDYAEHGTEHTVNPYRYSPGPWADYNAFRLDTYHRLTLPMKFADVLSVVPRFGIRGTYWSDSGYENLDGRSRAGSTGDDVWRTVVEGGITFAARGRKTLKNGLTHIIEPYFDVLAQEAKYSGLDDGTRPYVFDSMDQSSDYLDQFAGRSRNLPYSWYGVTPGIRNVLKRTDEDGSLRTIADFDLYCAVQFNDTSFTSGDKYHRLSKNPEDPNYGEDAPLFAPGLRARWFANKDSMLSARIEYDTENNELAYADVMWRERTSETFSYYVSYCARNHRWWDFASTEYDREVMDDEDFNWAHYQFLEIGFEQEICDAIVWSPYIRWDCREGEFDEIGMWIDYRTDCLGFRFSCSYENAYTRIDGSEYDNDWRCGFFVYLRALGPSSGSPFGD